MSGAADPAPVRRRWRTVARGLGGSAVLAAVAGVAVVAGSSPGTARTPEYAAADLGTAWPDMDGRRDFGPLADPQLLRSCLGASDVPLYGPEDVLGARRITLDGRSAMLLAFPTPAAAEEPPRVTLVAFDPSCTPDSVLVRTVVAR